MIDVKTNCNGLRKGYVFTIVCHSVQRVGGLADTHLWADTTAEQTPYWADSTPGQTPPWADPPGQIPLPRQTPPLGRHPHK